eukprot:5943533-Ditylum_brightwellii.AAC.1
MPQEYASVTALNLPPINPAMSPAEKDMTYCALIEYDSPLYVTLPSPKMVSPIVNEQDNIAEKDEADCMELAIRILQKRFQIRVI